jgi:Na+/H+ antiporter NhaD/arsenite permease-like protein
MFIYRSASGWGALELEYGLAIGIFIVAFALMISGKVHRTIAVIFGAVLMIGVGILDQSGDQSFFEYIEWETLGLIFGMFILVAALSESGFFRWLGLHALKLAKFQPLRIFILFSILAAFLAAFMDSITVLIFMASLIIEVCRILKMPILPFLLGAITSANIGGAATMVGDPPNVIVGTALGLNFMDFVTHTAPIAAVVFCVNLGFFYLWYKKIFKEPEIDPETLYEEHADLDPNSAIKDHRLMTIALCVFAFVVTLLALHNSLGLAVAFIAIMGATLVMVFGGKKMPNLVDKIDWHTILFLAGLFVMVGGLKAVGVLDSIAGGIMSVGGENLILTLVLLLWVSAFSSAFLDNVPFAAAMVGVIETMAETSNGALPLKPMAYTLCLGADIGGNATPIGASANVVGLAVAQKEGVKTTWKEYCKVAFPAMIVSMLVTTLLVVLMFGL